MGSLERRVAIVTGAGRGIGREHALALAAEGADIVVNDLGGSIDGSGSDAGPAEQVVAEIEAMGGRAIANNADVTDWEGVKALVDQTVEVFGDLHILVNNAGILRDRFLVNMSEDEWDAVIAVHMKGHFVPTRWASAYWRGESKKGKETPRAIINTASPAMLGNLGQFNYAGAKAAIAAMTFVAAGELGRYGVKANCLAPVARTRMTLATPGLDEIVKAPDDPEAFDVWAPANVSPLVAYLATADCPFTGGIFHVGANEIGLYNGFTLPDDQILATDGQWTVDALSEMAPLLLDADRAAGSAPLGPNDLFAQFGRRPPTR